MINIVTYHSQNAPDNLRWLAFVLLPSGKIWDVRFSGATEEEARLACETLWQSEVDRLPKEVDPWAPVKPHHLAGKKWAIHKITREKRFDVAVEIEALIATGDWEAAGARSK